MNKLTETEKSYLAGFIDGEGCISITKYQGKNNKSPVYSLAVIVGMAKSAEEALCYWRDKTGLGTIHYQKSKNKNRQGSIRWNISAISAVELLSELLPYLIIKREQAKIAIDFQSGFGNLAGNIGYPGSAVPDGELARREKAFLELKKAKKDFVKIIAFVKNF